MVNVVERVLVQMTMSSSLPGRWRPRSAQADGFGSWIVADFKDFHVLTPPDAATTSPIDKSEA